MGPGGRIWPPFLDGLTEFDYKIVATKIGRWLPQSQSDGFQKNGGLEKMSSAMAARWLRWPAVDQSFQFAVSHFGPDICSQLNLGIGLRENLQESPIFNGKIYGFL